MRDLTRDVFKRFEEAGKAAADAAAEQAMFEGFLGVDRRAVAAMSDLELATWNARHPAGSPQAILAEHEWQRRLTVLQVQATRYTAWIAGVTGVLGALGGVALQYFLTKP